MPAFSRLKRVLRVERGSKADATIETIDKLNYRVDALPNAQTAIDALPGWSHRPLIGDDGTPDFYPDPRIEWCLECAGPLAGCTVLELGPLDGAHTALLAQAGPASIVAIEANSLAFLRCLVTREVMSLRNTVFMLGDFNSWMEECENSYDLIICCGVLYHSKDPIKLINLICKRAKSFYLWTHYFDDAAMPPEDLRRVPFSGRVLKSSVDGKRIDLHERSYFSAWRDQRFCGGFQDQHYWMTKPDIIWMIHRHGFVSVIAHDEPDHVNGPAFSLFARRV